MRTNLSPQNPFGPNRFGFAFEMLREHPTVRAHLDYGCFDGSFLTSARRAINQQVLFVGVDVNEIALANLVKGPSHCLGVRISDRGTLPFGDNAFDSISCLEVLEHVSETRRRELLREFHRILRPQGILIVSVPGRHIFSTLDLGNIKFRMPSLHRIFVERRRGKAYYDQRYRNNKFRLIGDISVDARWHMHFSHEQLSSLVNQAGFDVVTVDGAGLFSLVLTLFAVMLPVPQVKSAIHRLQVRDAQRWEQANLFMMSARRRG